MDNHASRIQNTLLNNRVKILKLCDYFTVSAPLIAKRLLPLDTHKEIRKSAMGILDPKAANTARMDALLDFIDEVPNPLVFDAFLDGIKNCESSKQFAKVLKKEAEAGIGGAVMKLPPVLKPPTPKTNFGKSRPTPTSPPVQSFQNSIFGGNPMINGPTSAPFAFSFGNPGSFSTAYIAQAAGPTHYGAQIPRPAPTPNLNISAPVSTQSIVPTPAMAALPAKKRAPKKPKPKVPNGPPVADAASTDVFAFNPNANSAPAIPKTRTPRPPKKSARKSVTGAAGQPSSASAASKPEPANKTGNTTASAVPVKKETQVKKEVQVKKEKKPVIKKVYPSKSKPKPATKVVTPGPSLTANLVYIKPEAGPSSLIPSTPKSSDAGKGFTTKVPAGSPFRPKNGVSKAQQHAKPMTFQEAEAKQKSTTRGTGFSFVNSGAVVKKIDFNNKSDLFYEGCPTKEGNYLCTRKVQLKGKGKKYVCKEKHENEAYELFPRLYVNFGDSTGEMEMTVFRENVEILAGKSVSDMHAMNDTALSTEFAKAIGINIPIRVTSEKILKKDLKRSGGKTWNNVAHIIIESGNQSGPPAKKAKKTE